MRSLRDLVEVQEAVNADVRYRCDLSLYGKLDHWARPVGGQGDCEDYALEKLARLEARGWPRATLRLATCWTELGEYHAVLTVDTDHGTYVLDNRYPRPVPWDEVPYRWDRREDPTTGQWHLIRLV